MIERLHAKVTMKDRDGNLSAVTVTLPFASTIAQVYAFAVTLSNAMLALSNAIVSEIKITYTSRVEVVESVPGTSLAQQRALIFYRNDADVIHTISIPCARNDIWLTSGVYRDQIIDDSMPGYSALIVALEAVASACIYADGEQIPASYITIARCE